MQNILRYFCSIKEAGKWLNQEEILEILNLESFHEKAL
jgi:hypothetical protein